MLGFERGPMRGTCWAEEVGGSKTGEVRLLLQFREKGLSMRCLNPLVSITTTNNAPPFQKSFLKNAAAFRCYPESLRDRDTSN